MRVLYLDIDCLRPDHLGCYGYARPTSPAIDAIARTGVRFDNVYASDVPCLPSRTAFFSGRFGVHTGVVNHGGAQAEMFGEGAGRGFGSRHGRTNLVRCLRDLGFHAVSVSSFAERHAAYHFCAGWNEIQNPGKRGLESADEVAGLARAWLAANARRDRWFLHVNFWDPHTPYRAPAAFGDPFGGAPPPVPWLDEAVRRAHWQGCGPHSAREVMGYDDQPPPGVPWDYPRQPLAVDSLAAAHRLIDGYDTGIRYADGFVAALVQQLADAGVLDETAIIVSADHGENLGELNVYGDHQTADQATARVPLVMRWPGVTDAGARVRTALHYQVDFAATLIDLLGGQVPAGWDGVSFARALASGQDVGRDALVLSQAAWTCQRAVRFRRDGRDYLCIRTYHDGHHGYPDVMLFDLAADPHEQVDLQAARPAVVHEALARLERWLGEMMTSATHPADPFWVVLHEGGPKHTRGQLPAYLERLRRTDRAAWADELARRHPREAAEVPLGK